MKKSKKYLKPEPPESTDVASVPSPNQKPEIIHQKSLVDQKCLPEFAGLPPDQLDYIHDLLRQKTYEEAQQEIWSTLGCRISISRLHRYREKIDLAAALEIASEDTGPAVDQLNNLLTGRETNIAAAGLLLIQQRALALAAAPKTSPTLLKDLFRIFTYEDRKKDNAHRRQIAEQREATRQQTADDRRSMNEHRKQIDHHHARLAEQREQTRQRLADLAERKHADAQKLAVERQPKHFDQDQMTADIEAIKAYGREYLRQQAAAKQAAETNQKSAIINQK